jgi:hypothetical protein
MHGENIAREPWLRNIVGLDYRQCIFYDYRVYDNPPEVIHL